MKPGIYSFYFILVFLIAIKGTAQQKYKRDTLYYYADTAATPKADRMVTLGVDAFSGYGKRVDTIRYLKIECACLPFGYYPELTVHKGRYIKEIQADALGRIQFLSLPSLIAVFRKDYKKDFRSKHTIMIVEKQQQHYYMQQMFLTEYSDPSIDYEIIHP